MLSLQPAQPSSDSDADRRAAALFAAYWNDAFLEPLMDGKYPALIAERLAPLIAAGDLATIKHKVDFLGVNYYAPAYIADAPGSLFGAWFGAVPAGTRFTAMNWPIVPDGLYELLMTLNSRYPDLDLYITENGACFDDTVAADGSVNDADRVAFLRDHIAAASRAVAAGARLRGYFVWSLLGQFRMGGRLQPPLRRGPRRFRDAEAHAEGVVCVSRGRHAPGLNAAAAAPCLAPNFHLFLLRNRERTLARQGWKSGKAAAAGIAAALPGGRGNTIANL